MKKQTRMARLRTSKRIKRATNIITVAMLVCPLAIGAAKVLATSTNEQPVVQEKVTTQEITDVENQSTVDVSALQTEVNIYHNLNEVEYHPVDWKYFEERITEPIIEATNILNNPTHGKEQWEIDNITQTINYAIAFLNPELVTLQAKYNEYLALNEADYTPSSWQLFQTEVEEGFALSYTINDLYDDSIYNGLTIEPISLTMERWESAFALLVLNDGNPIITSITIEGKTTIEIGETATLRAFNQLGNPVQATWITPDASIIEKHSTDGYSLEITGVKAGKVELSASELVTGITTKQTITVVDEPVKPINKLKVSKLKAEIETSAKINPSEELYTKKSLDIFIKQLAQSTVDLEKANIQNDKLAKNTARDLVVGSITQENVDASEKALTKARLGLNKNDDDNNQTIDVTKLTAELETSKKLLKDEALYTKNSWAVFFKQYKQSSKDLEDFLAQTSSRAIQKSNFTQDDIDASMNALKTARLALEKVKKDITDPPIVNPDDKGNIDNNKSKDNNKSNNNKSNNNKTDKNNKILPKTNDTNIIMTSLLGLEMSLVCGLIYWVRKRKEIL